jgi:hypothetical protein
VTRPLASRPGEFRLGLNYSAVASFRMGMSGGWGCWGPSESVGSMRQLRYDHLPALQELKFIRENPDILRGRCAELQWPINLLLK